MSPTPKEPLRKSIDWASLIIPICFTLLLQLGTGLFFVGGITTRLTNIEDKVHVIDKDRVTRHDIEERDTTAEVYRQELNIRLNRMDDKLDRIILNQSDVSGAK